MLLSSLPGRPLTGACLHDSLVMQADHRAHAQIHSIIVALSLHVVVLIKDLNGNQVIQKCLNKLAPEDNQVCYIHLVICTVC